VGVVQTSEATRSKPLDGSALRKSERAHRRGARGGAVSSPAAEIGAASAASMMLATARTGEAESKN